MADADDLTPEQQAVLDALESDEATDALLFEAGVSVRPETDDELHAWMATYQGFAFPRTAVCPGHRAPFEFIADLFFDRYMEDDLLAIGGRGSGKTQGFACAEHLLQYFTGDEIVNVGAIEKQALQCYQYLTDLWYKPHFRPMLAKPPLIKETLARNGGKVEIAAGTVKALNGPHPRVTLFDELDLLDRAALREGLSMAVDKGGRPARTVFTSSLKFPFGNVVRMFEEAERGERNLREYRWCVFESIKRCQPERHQDGEGCKTCPLAKAGCLDATTDEFGDAVLAPGPGKAARADGFLDIDFVIKKFRSLDEQTWLSQWLSKKPQTEGLVYPSFDTHHVVDYEYNPALPVYEGVDFGYTNPSAVISLQVTPDGYIVAFDELYEAKLTNEELAAKIKRRPWYSNTMWRMGDPAAAEGRATLNKHGVIISAADNTKDTSKDTSGISKIRWLLAPQGRPTPLLYVARRCTNLIREFRSYHVDDEKEDRNRDERPVKSEDHALDALRYAITRLVRKTA